MKQNLQISPTAMAVTRAVTRTATTMYTARLSFFFSLLVPLVPVPLPLLPEGVTTPAQLVEVEPDGGASSSFLRAENVAKSIVVS